MTTWRKLLTLLAATLLVVGFAACGDDDDDDTAVGADDASTTTEAEAEAEGDDDHDMPDAEDGNPCAPDAPDDALPPAEELDPDGAEITITAKDYAFEGAEPLAEGGTFAVTFDNEGTEMHEFALSRLADSEERPLEEIVASGEEPELTEVAMAIACPGETTTVNVDVSEPGRYVAVCFIPVGTTPEATEAPEGPPHAAQGMVFEFEVSWLRAGFLDMISHEPAGYECPFCRIARGHLPDRVVYRNERVMTLVNIKWWENNPGGCLVVPIEHHENVFELPARLGTPIQAAVREIAIAMKSALGCDGISKRQNNEPAGNQDVWHHHTHVFPRWDGDDLYRTRGATVEIDAVNRMAALLRAHLPAPDLNAALPGKPSASGVVLTDADGRILIVKPTYRETWGIPGGGVDGQESPREGCVREIREELGLDLEPGALIAYEHRVNDAGIDTHRFLFEGPSLTHEQIDAIVLRADDVGELRFVTLDDAVALLDPPLGRRLRRAVEHRGEGRALYLEDGEIY